MLLFLLFFGCQGTPPSTQPCDAIVGSDSVVVFDLDDVLNASVPEAPPATLSEDVASLDGPDSLGWVYLTDHSGRLMRSADGCTWDERGALPTELSLGNGYEAKLHVDSAGETIFLSRGGGLVFASTDGGATFTKLPGQLAPRELALHPTDPDRIRFLGYVDSIFGLWESYDGGLSWASAASLPVEAGGGVFKPGDFDTLAVVGPELWFTTDGGASWTVSSEEVGGAMAWDDAGLAVRWNATHGDPYDPSSMQLAWRTDDLGATFGALPTTSDTDYSVRGMAMVDGTLVSAGFMLYGRARLEVTDESGTTVRTVEEYNGEVAGLAVVGDRVIVAFRGEYVSLD